MKYLINFQLFENNKRIIFTDEWLENFAKKFKTKKEFKEANRSAYQASVNRGKEFHDRITSHMNVLVRNSYTDSELDEISKKYKTKKEFKEANKNAYQASLNRGKEFHDRITSHMDILMKHFTDQELKNIALKYNYLKDFKKNDKKAYDNGYKRGRDFFNSITSHMVRQIKSYTEEQLENISKQFNTISDFVKNAPGAYVSSLKKGSDFFDKITSHMSRNIRKPYTEEELEEIAKKYNKKKDFQKNNESAYKSALSKGKDFFYKITSHMRTKWNDIDIEAEAKRWNNIVDFMNHSPNAYQYLLKHPQLFIQLTKHMDRKYENWDEEKIWNIAKNFFIRKKFREQAPNAYGALCRLNKKEPGILNKLTSHMDPPISDEEMKEKSSKYDKLADFMMHETEAYFQLIENPILFHKYCKHMSDSIIDY